jgi:ribonuclease P protein component
MPVPRFSKKELLVFFKTARRIVRHKALDVLAQPKTHAQARLLVVTPRRVGRAVDRNRVRRRLKHIFYEEQLFKNPYDYIIVIKKAALQLSFEQLKELLCQTIVQYENRTHS